MSLQLPSEWPNVDIIHPSLPTIVASSDLFDGELFGDELIDIYDSTVDTHNANDGTLGLNNLLSQSKKGEEFGDQIIDDGFGTFRPSTSYNDLSSFLTTAAAPTKSEPKVEAKVSKKRNIEPTLNAPSSAKRKTPYVRRGSTNVKKDTPPAKKVKENETSIAPAEVASGPKVDHAPIPKQITTTIVPSSISQPTTVSSGDIGLTDDDDVEFKSNSQAIESNFTNNSDGVEESESYVDTSNEKVDTSTAHIRALTGNNWVAACAGTTQGIGSVSDDTDSKTGGCNRNRHRQNLTPDERARQNRDRNREHARNTRLRKKAYVEELKRTLSELVSQRDAADIEKRHAAQRELEQREVRFRVIEEFLKLRGRNETNFARWAAILEDGFSFTLPSMDFRKITQGGPAPSDETVIGVSDVMANAIVFSDFLQTLGNKDGSVTCQFNCERQNFFMDGCHAVLEWRSSTVGAVAKGSSAELVFSGIVRGKFSPDSNKLVSANMTCDTGAVYIQLQKMSVAFDSGTSNAAAQAAANQADALLDSIEMPCLQQQTAFPVAVIVDTSSSSSDSSGDDESEVEQGDKVKSVPLIIGKDALLA